MTEKQFNITTNEDNVIVITNDGEIMTPYEVCDLLNKFEEENRQLILELDTHKHPLWSTREAERIVNKLKQENEQLKQELKIYRKVANCSNCRYHSYDWFDDGDEFEVCDKGNDVTDGICEEWEEL